MLTVPPTVVTLQVAINDFGPVLIQMTYYGHEAGNIGNNIGVLRPLLE
jgi:hypothetical protein